MEEKNKIYILYIGYYKTFTTCTEFLMEVSNMTFQRWVKLKYLDDPTAKGSLARGMKADAHDFARPMSRKKLRTWIAFKGADDAVLAAFDECWAEYEAERNIF